MSRTKIAASVAAVAAAGALFGGGAAIAMAQNDTPAMTSAVSANQTSTGTQPNARTEQGSLAQQGRASGQVAPGGQGMAPPDMGGHEHTAVNGDELAKVSAAVTAKFSGVTVEAVAKDPDGSYDVHATKDGVRVMYEVSADLKTIEERTGGPGTGGPGLGAPGMGGADQGGNGQAPTGSLNPTDANGTGTTTPAAPTA